MIVAGERLGAAETLGDLGDPEPLRLPEVPRQRDGSAQLGYTVIAS